MPDYEYPGLELVEDGGTITMTLTDLSIRFLKTLYEDTHCLLTDPTSLESSYDVPLIAQIRFNVVDTNGVSVYTKNVPYIDGKWVYTTTYTHIKSEKLAVLANVEVTQGTCGQWLRYYSPKYVTIDVVTSEPPPLEEDEDVLSDINLVLQTSPTVGISFGPWRFDTSFVGGARTFYHSANELPIDTHLIKNGQSDFDWPDDVKYKLIVEFKRSGNWIKKYEKVTIDNSTYNEFDEVTITSSNAILTLDDDDTLRWNNNRLENYYIDGKGYFAGVECVAIDEVGSIFDEIGRYRIYVNRYVDNVLVSTSNRFIVDVISDDVVVGPDEPPVDGPDTPPDTPPVVVDELPIPSTYKLNETPYFKHTNGEAFTLNDSDYYGFFHVIDGVAYVGRTYLESDVVLTPKNTVISKVFTESHHFDTCFGNTKDISEVTYVNAFDLLNLQGLNKLIDDINANNLKCYENLVINNPTVYNFTSNNNHYYGLSTFEFETRYKWNLTDDKWRLFDIKFGSGKLIQSQALGLPAKTTYSYTRPFNINPNWEFLSRITMGIFFISPNDDFKYYCSDGNTTYTLSGNFVETSPLHLISSTTHDSKIYNIHHDQENNRIFLVKDDKIEIYDSSSFDNCNKFILIDEILIEDYNSIQTKLVKFGKNIRTLVTDDNVIQSYNKYSAEKYTEIDLKDFGVKNIQSLDVREVDDNIIMLYKLNTGQYVCYFDPNNIENTFLNTKIEGLSSLSAYPNNVEFSKIDSNIFHTYNRNEFQSRSLTFPLYPNGRLELENLLYHDFQYKWNETTQCYNFLNILWNANDRDSNTYTNIFTTQKVKNNSMYIILHNEGRIYTIKQPVNDRYLTAIPLSLVKFFNESTCSESSFGLYFNTTITNIVKDLLNIYNNASNTFTFDERETFLNKLNEFTIAKENLYLNGNESINILAFKRILLNILDIQKKLIPN